MLGVGLAVVSWSIKSAVFFSLSLTYVWAGWSWSFLLYHHTVVADP